MSHSTSGELARIVNVSAISQLRQRYADAVTDRNGEEWATTWLADAVWDLGDGQRLEGRDEVCAFWEQAMSHFAIVVQQVTGSTATVDVAAGTATGQSSIMEHYRLRNGTTGLMLGRYTDHLQRVRDRWGFLQRTLTIHYRGPADLSGSFRDAG